MLCSPIHLPFFNIFANCNFVMTKNIFRGKIDKKSKWSNIVKNGRYIREPSMNDAH